VRVKNKLRSWPSPTGTSRTAIQVDLVDQDGASYRWVLSKVLEVKEKRVKLAPGMNKSWPKRSGSTQLGRRRSAFCRLYHNALEPAK